MKFVFILSTTLDNDLPEKVGRYPYVAEQDQKINSLLVVW